MHLFYILSFVHAKSIRKIRALEKYNSFEGANLSAVDISFKNNKVDMYLFFFYYSYFSIPSTMIMYSK